MKYAEVEGRRMSIQEYSDRPEAFRSAPGVMLCLECRAEVGVKAIVSNNVAAHFSHPPKPDCIADLDDCSRAARGGRLRWFGEHERDIRTGRIVRDRFFEKGSVKAAYAFCLACVGRGNLPLSKFREMIERADRIVIWSYVGMDVWCVPHILLLLADFGVGTERPCHFSLEQASKVSSIWQTKRPVLISKIFSDRGNMAKTMTGQPNPRPILRTDVGQVDASWIASEFVNALLTCRNRQRANR